MNKQPPIQIYLGLVVWRPALLLALGLFLVFTPQPTQAQGFRVQPMRIETDLPPGRTATIPIQVSNTAGNQTRLVEIMLVDLNQTSSGSWSPVLPDSDQPIDHLMSCREWITLEAEAVEIEALGRRQLDLRMRIPPDARGTYTAALLVQSQPLGDPEAAVRLQVRFLVPLIIRIEGRPVRQQIELTNLSLRFREADEGYDENREATTLGGMRIANRGRTYSRVRGELRVEMQHGERWRSVLRRELPERGILPGVTLALHEDLQRRLPSGIYRLRGELYVDGRRVKPLDKTIELDGDPEADILAFDAALLLEPNHLALEAAPGATRTSMIMVENPSDETLQVRAGATVPESLQGVAMGELEGDMLSAAVWVQVRPAEFTLRPDGRQNLRVLTRIPRDGVDQAHYYADLTLHASYADGQSAGPTRLMLTVANQAVKTEAKVIIDRFGLSREEEDNFIVQGQFVNVGNVHLAPMAETALFDGSGEEVARARLGGDSSLMLPLAVRQFAGTIDFKNLEPGDYLLRTFFSDDGRLIESKQAPLLVAEDEDGAKSVRIVAEQ